MKINGREIKGPNRVTLVLPREGGEDIVIIAEAVIDMNGCDKYLKMPEPPVVLKPSGKEQNFSDPGFVQQLEQYNIKKMAWIMLMSLAPSNIEWDTVDMENPSTWANYNQELKDAGFSEIEINRIGNACMEANALDEAKLEAARQSFLRGQAGK
jgi:hypothetical protein